MSILGCNLCLISLRTDSDVERHVHGVEKNPACFQLLSGVSAEIIQIFLSFLQFFCCLLHANTGPHVVMHTVCQI